MQSVRTGFFIATFLCLSQQAAFAEESVDTSVHQHPVEEVNTNTPVTEGEFDPRLKGNLTLAYQSLNIVRKRWRIPHPLQQICYLS